MFLCTKIGTIFMLYNIYIDFGDSISYLIVFVVLGNMC